MSETFRIQEGFDVRFDWGPKAVEHFAPLSSAVVLIDVLRFGTAVDAVIKAGGQVRPLPWAERDGRAATDRYLSPWALEKETKPGSIVELPSPNGAELSVLAASYGANVFAACLRNAHAVATTARALADGRPITVIACGERWEDGQALRPCIEDHLGAGAVLSELGAGLSPEAETACRLFLSLTSKVPEILRECATARELRERGFENDVIFAADVDVSDMAPVLRDGVYVDGRQVLTGARASTSRS